MCVRVRTRARVCVCGWVGVSACPEAQPRRGFGLPPMCGMAGAAVTPSDVSVGLLPVFLLMLHLKR